MKLLERAAKTNDATLAQATLTMAMERLWYGVQESYLAEHPSDTDALVELRMIVAPDKKDAREEQMAMGMLFTLSKPPSIASQNDYAIAELVRDT